MRLYPIIEEPGAKELFYIFRDLTTGKETYPAGRFFYSDIPKDGKVVLDFNKAYNPPCAFTPYATCPLRPRKTTCPCESRRARRTITSQAGLRDQLPVECPQTYAAQRLPAPRSCVRHVASPLLMDLHERASRCPDRRQPRSDFLAGWCGARHEAAKAGL